MSVRALGLLSGSLDSLLAVELLRRRGVRVECVHFSTGFNREAYAGAVQRGLEDAELPPTQVIDARAEYFEQVVCEPRHPRGPGLSACIDCRVFMLRRAAELAAERGIELLFSGEVLGQSAHGQRRADLATIDREAGLEGRVLRPLSAALLEPTLAGDLGVAADPESGRLHGRSRRGQLRLAERFGLTGFALPSGECCRLAEPRFARRLREHLAHRAPGPWVEGELDLLESGRHFRLAWNLKLVVGRDEGESARLQRLAGAHPTCQVASGHGTLGLIVGRPDERGLERAASVVARYSRERESARVEVRLRRGTEERRMQVAPAGEDALDDWRV